MRGKFEVSKIKGERNPADLMTKVLNLRDIQKRLEDMGIVMKVDR